MRVAVCVCLALLLGACVWKPVTYGAPDREATGAALESFRSGGELARYFDEAVAWAVFPGSYRAGTGFGGAYGRGWLFEQGAVTGQVQLLEFFAGVNFGAQSYRSILFFRTESALRRFRRGRTEFTGQANATLVTAGVPITPSYNRDVAMFVQVRGGLLLEASVGAQRYDFFPLAPAQ